MLKLKLKCALGVKNGIAVIEALELFLQAFLSLYFIQYAHYT